MFEFNEFEQVGINYGKPDKALAWHTFRKSRPYSLVLEWLNLTKKDVFIDIGCGSGLHLEVAAKICSFVHGLDVSESMLQIARETLSSYSNICLHHAGFLSLIRCDLSPHPTCAFSWGALHHLPDFWKFVALRNVSLTLRSGSYFLLEDMVWCFDPHNFEKALNRLLLDHKTVFGDDVEKDLIRNIQEEFVAFDFVLEELVARAGFNVKRKQVSKDQCFATYLLQRS